VGKLPGAREAKVAMEGEVAELESFHNKPINLKRTFEALAPSTWEGYATAIWSYMGFALKYGGVLPSLLCYLNATLFVMFLAFLQARNTKKAALIKHCLVAEKVLQWLRATGRAAAVAPTNKKRCRALSKMFKRLRTQISKNMVDCGEVKGVRGLRQRKKWVEPEELMLLVHKVWQGAFEALMAKGEGGYTVEIAIKVQMALICCCFFGYMPSMRPSVVASLTVPSYKGPCKDETCQHPSRCAGNILYWSEDGIDDDSRLGLYAQHHKTQKKANNSKPIDIAALPLELAVLLLAHLLWGRGLLGMIAPKRHPFVFVEPNTGKPIKYKRVNVMFIKTVFTNMDLRIGPQMCRSIFVHLMRHKESWRAANAGDEDACAHIMGNCKRTWDSVYDKDRAVRRAQESIRLVEEWRAEVLGKAGVEVQREKQLVVQLHKDLLKAWVAANGKVAKPSTEQELESEGMDDCTSEPECSIEGSGATSGEEVEGSEAAVSSDGDDESSSSDGEQESSSSEEECVLDWKGRRLALKD
jgi:hypothetical protein